jgi:fumarylacetoacetase
VTGFGVFSTDGRRRVGWRCGGELLDLAPAGLGTVFAEPTLGPFMTLGRAAWDDAVERIAAAVEARAGPRLPAADVELHLPFEIADYVDFNASLAHVTAMGRRFRPDEPVLPNWRHMPVGYHGRAGAVVVSGTPVRRPGGQVREGVFGPTQELDVELELAFVVGRGSDGPVALEDFREHVLGVVLLNDWSARDVQAWESRPLGPFLGKSFATSIAATVTPLALLEPARVEAPPQDPAPLPYLAGDRDWALDVELELEWNGEVVSRPNARGLYWTGPQLLAHLTSNGARLRPGDLIATGTISEGGPGSLTELGRGFLADGDEVVLRGRAAGVELGEVRARVLPA